MAAQGLPQTSVSGEMHALNSEIVATVLDTHCELIEKYGEEVIDANVN